MPSWSSNQIGAGVNAAGQHSGIHYSVFTHMPGIKCVAPSTPADAKGLLLTAIRDDDLVMFFENKVLYGMKGEVPEGDEGIPFGVADIKRWVTTSRSSQFHAWSSRRWRLRMRSRTKVSKPKSSILARFLARR